MSLSQNKDTTIKRSGYQQYLIEVMVLLKENGLNERLLLWMDIGIDMWRALTDEEREEWRRKAQGLASNITPNLRPETRGLICYANEASPLVEAKVGGKSLYTYKYISVMWSILPKDEIVLWVEKTKGPSAYLEKYQTLLRLLRGHDIFFMREMRYCIVEMLFKISVPLPPSIPESFPE